MPYEGIIRPTIVQSIRSYDSHVVDFYMINRIGKSDDTFGASGRLGFKKPRACGFKYFSMFTLTWGK